MDSDTSIGGHQDRFPETHQPAIANVQSDEPSVRDCGAEALIAVYWKPVYKYIRVRWNLSNEDAKDLTQAFFTRALEKDFFRSYDPAKARFRTFLRTCLDAFLANENKAAGRARRGGDAHIVSLDFETAEGELRRREIASRDESPEQYFHREWVRNLFSLALEDLRRDCHERGKHLQYSVFERYDLQDGSEPVTYENVAAEFGISTQTCTNYLAAMRRMLRRLVLERLRETTTTGREFRSEARSVLGIEA